MPHNHAINVVVSVTVIHVFLQLVTSLGAGNVLFQQITEPLYDVYSVQVFLLLLLILFEYIHIHVQPREPQWPVSIFNLGILINCLFFYALCTLQIGYAWTTINNRVVNVNRTLQWLATCTLMITNVSKFSGAPTSFVINSILYTQAMLVCGMLADFSPTLLFQALFGSTATLFCAIMLFKIHHLLEISQNNAPNEITTRSFAFLRYFMTISWCIFPCIYLVASLQLVSFRTEALLYMCGDNIAKIIFILCIQRCGQARSLTELNSHVEHLHEKHFRDIRTSQLESQKNIEFERSQMLRLVLDSIGNPMSCITQCVSEVQRLIQTKLLNDNDLRRVLVDCQRSNNDMDKVMRQVLLFTNLNSRKRVVKQNEFYIITLIDKVIARARRYHPDFEIEYKCDESLTAVQGDFHLMRVVLDILVDNACKYCDKMKEMKLEVIQIEGDARTDQQSEERCTRVKFIVSDNGRPIDPISRPCPWIKSEVSEDDEEAIGDDRKFYSYAGTSLSLALAKRITSLLGGSLHWRSLERSEIQFEFRLKMKFVDVNTDLFDIYSFDELDPCTVMSETHSAHSYFKSEATFTSSGESTPERLTQRRLQAMNRSNTSPHRMADKLTNNLHRRASRIQCHILICDDNITQIKLMQRAIQRMSFNGAELVVHTAKNGQIGLEVCKKHNIHLIFLDNVMPVMDGNSFLREYFKINRSHAHDNRSLSNLTKIYGITANSDQATIDRMIELGATEVFKKPLQHDRIESCIVNTLNLLRTTNALNEFAAQSQN